MKRILIVDDDPHVLESMISRLQKGGYQVYSANNGLEAYVMATVQQFDLIVLDMVMPIMDGYTFITEIKGRTELNKVPILVMSAYIQSKAVFEEMGVVDFLIKPFNAQNLLSNVEHCLQHQ